VPSTRLPASLLALGLCLTAGCGGDASPTDLIDGSRAPAVPAELTHLGHGLVMTSAAVVHTGEVADELRACDPTLHLAPSRPVVRRVGVVTESLTFRTAPSGVRGCDRARGAVVETGGKWCGTSVGLVTLGRLRDPRLELCQDRNGRPVAAFAWIDPVPGTRWIVVDQGDRDEVYPRAGALPVRIATAVDIDAESASAVFDYAEYDARGRLIESTTIHPFVAG